MKTGEILSNTVATRNKGRRVDISVAKAVRQISERHDLRTIWAHFIELSAICLSIADLAQKNKREERYLSIMKQYEVNEQARFAQAFGVLVQTFENNGIDDILGHTFMKLGLGSKGAGQVFTPLEVCRMMARTQIAGMAKTIRKRKFVTVYDPTVGAGAMPLALCLEMQHAGLNYQQVLHVTAQDIDEKAVHMCYIQLALAYVPATIYVGDTLRMQVREVWYTPAHILGGWAGKLAHRRWKEKRKLAQKRKRRENKEQYES